jgi:hypothetical protein
MEGMFPAFGLNPDEVRKALAVDPHALEALREAGVKERPVWREAWDGPNRTVELSTKKNVYLTLKPIEMLTLTEQEIADRIRRRLAEGSTLQTP